MSEQPNRPQSIQPPPVLTQITDRFSYDRQQNLGSGTYGFVYRGFDAQEGRPIAVKVIKRSKANMMKWDGDELIEVTIHRRLSGQHPNILQYYGSIGSRISPEIYIFTELCEKGTLSGLITKLTELETFLLFQQLVEGMQFLSRLNILHRDLKPANLLITAKNQLKIADFGTARDFEQEIKSKPSYTPIYASPEIYIKDRYNEGEYDQKSDVFSAGYILYEMLAGERLNKNVKNIEVFFNAHRKNGFIIDHPAISLRWAKLIRKMLDFDPTKRPSFTELNAILRNFEAPLDKLPAFRTASVIEEEDSSKYVEKIKCMVGVMYNRNNYLISILKVFSQFQEQRSQLIPRIYKVMLLYLSLSMYCLLSQDALSMLDRKGEFSIDGISVDEMEERLTIADRAEVGAFLKETRGRISRGMQQMNGYLLRKVDADIEEVSRTAADNPERLVLEEFQILKELKQQRESGEFGVLSYLELSLKRCANNLYRTTEELELMSNADLVTYLTVLYVANLDKYVNLVDYRTSTLPPKVEQILSMDREQLGKEIALQKNKN